MTDALVERCAADWRAATHHAFLDGVKNGTLSPAHFERWLVQDYLFVLDLLRFQARLLARAPRSAQAVLAGGLVALEAELGWFEQHAGQRGLALDVARGPVASGYADFLLRLDVAPFAVAITALWALERAYLDAWTNAAPGSPPYVDFVAHWTTLEFADYVARLAAAADAALAAADQSTCAMAETAFADVVRLEREFWGAT